MNIGNARLARAKAYARQRNREERAAKQRASKRPECVAVECPACDRWLVAKSGKLPRHIDRKLQERCIGTEGHE